VPLPITNITDFVGTTQLQEDDNTEDKFNVIRDERENTYIFKLLGAELGNLFIADLDANGVPQTARFTDIFEAFAEDVSSGFCFEWMTINGLVESKGIKQYLIDTVWFYFARNNPVLITTGGNKISESENSSNSADGATLGRIYNKAVDTGLAIQWFIEDKPTIYPEYNGQKLKYIIPN